MSASSEFRGAAHNLARRSAARSSLQGMKPMERLALNLQMQRNKLKRGSIQDSTDLVLRHPYLPDGVGCILVAPPPWKNFGGGVAESW